MKADTIAHDKWHCRITGCAQNKARQIGRAYFPRDNSQKYAHPTLEKPLRFIAHGRITANNYYTS